MNRISIETALSCLEAGLSVLPAERERKRPAVGSWKTWAGRLPTRIEVEAWFANAHDAVCVVAGKVSGNLECIDFDNRGELFGAWKGKVGAELFARLVVERSPSGGCHVLYRTEGEVDGNMKLARGVRDGKLTTLVETRGEGGLFLCCPTEGYVLRQGDFAHIPTISSAEREALVSAARSLDEEGARRAAPPPAGAAGGASGGFLARPGDDFSERGDIRPYLSAAGWTRAGCRQDGNELWVRPGKDPRAGHSATFDGRVFYVFSSNAAPFEPERGYSQFQAYALLEHRGDYTRAAAALLDKGYGTREEEAPKVDFSGFNAKLGRMASPPPPPPAGRFVYADVLMETYPELRPVLIQGFLRVGETMNVIAPPKTGKSWLVTDLALSVATGGDWFGYPCSQGKVLIIDNELHPETSANRLPKVFRARGWDPAKVGKLIAIENQRGELKTIEAIGANVEAYRAEGFRLIIIDAFYRAMPRGVDENDNGAVADVYNLLDRYAKEIGCAFVLIHHTSKGNQSLKAVTDVGAGAGSQSRAADTHVILRRHRERDVVVMESVVRSFPSVPPICLRWRWPLWNPDESLNPEDLDGKDVSRIPKTGSEEALEVSAWVRKVPSLVDQEHPEPKGVFVNRLQELANTSRTKARMIFESALDLGYVKCERIGGAENGKRSAKFVLVGDVRPPEDKSDGGDGELEDGD